MVILGLLIASLWGCDRHTRHKVLTFFFTGVPPLEEGKKAPEEGKEVAEAQKVQKKRRLISKAIPFSHGPYAARLCDGCHDTSPTVDFRRSTRRQAGGIGRTRRGIIVAPIKELCTECHTYKSAQRAYEEGLWLHGPVAEGNCVICHSPHESPNPYLLRVKSEEICIGCHSEGYIVNTAVHSGSRDCLSCHNPHLGKDMLLLVEGYNEVF